MSASTWDTGDVLTQIVAIVTAIAGVQSVVKGVPETLSTRAMAYVTVGSHRFDERNRAQSRWTRFLVVFGYRVRGMEATAETTIAAWVDALMIAVLTDPTLGNRVTMGTTVDASLSENPLYVSFAGAEARLYPVVIECQQYQAFDVA